MSLTWIKPSMPLETLVPGDLGPVNEPVGDSDIDEEPEARDIRDCPVEHLTSLRRRDASSFRRRANLPRRGLLRQDQPVPR